MQPPLQYEVQIDTSRNTIIIYTEWYFYGDLATAELAHQIAEDAQNAWNEPQAKILIEDSAYDVSFEMQGKLLNNDQLDSISINRYPWKKFFKIVDNNHLNISFVDGLYSNSGQFVIKNVKKLNSKTAAHELGHMWGLEHPSDTDYRAKGQPHIMLPRGSFVDAEYRYKPNAELHYKDGQWYMDEGFTVDTDKRKVLQKNVEDLRLERLNFNEEGFANLSGLSNAVH